MYNHPCLFTKSLVGGGVDVVVHVVSHNVNIGSVGRVRIMVVVVMADLYVVLVGR